MAEQTAFNSTFDASSNFCLFVKSSFKNLTAFDICERASINGKLIQLTLFHSLELLLSRALLGWVQCY
ncbi:hypothetical protein GOBAR_AA20053 [Gossypium barbadense]|uniref:Uncharacterized protein n=1 Tax=Gossypium barbadense TaxID=3634 RepID=A0A2P5XB87_GOSBA|nr:hypothetical protein GOBAR_AA20053 [Gossypium barbadense]